MNALSLGTNELPTALADSKGGSNLHAPKGIRMEINHTGSHDKSVGEDILLVEDHALMAEATKALLLEQSPLSEVVAVGSANEALAMLRNEPRRWRLILLDLGIPGAIGLSVACQIKAMGLASITCVFSGTERRDYIEQVRKEGFLGYLPKRARIPNLRTAFKAVLEGRPVFPILAAAEAKQSRLSDRQVQILQLLSEGNKSKAIARQLDLSSGTIDNHIAAASIALGAKTRTQAVLRALTLGLVTA